MDCTGHDVAQALKDEAFLCDFDDFLASYGPITVPDEDIVGCQRTLAALLENLHSLEHSERQASGAISMESDRSTHFQSIVDHIWAFAESTRKKTNKYLFGLSPRAKGDVARSDHEMDACIMEDGYIDALPNNAVVVPVGFRTPKELVEGENVREQILAKCYHILSEDPRQMFIYALTLENDRASVLYLSRTHIVKARSFDWITRDADKFIATFLSFAYATPEELGIDPYVHKSPSNNGHYIYEFPPAVVKSAGADEPFKTAGTASEDLKQPTKKSFYLTQESLSVTHPVRMSGRVTRIWKAIEIRSLQDTAPARNASSVITKDVWLPNAKSTEGENQDGLFADVDAFVANGVKTVVDSYVESNPDYPKDVTAREEHESSPAMLQHFIETEPRCKGFDAKTKQRLRDLLTGKTYRSLFLTKLQHFKGRVSKPCWENANLCPNIFQTLPTRCTATGHPRRIHGASDYAQEHKDGDIQTHRKWEQKQQNRFVYKEVCLELYQLPTLGDVMDVLSQAADALLIMFCAGWLHRDISLGNILGLETANGYQVKLADLEFAQRMNESEHKSDPQVGTPFFMAFEIMTRQYLMYLRPIVNHNQVSGSLASKFELLPEHPHYDLLSRIKKDLPFSDLTELPANMDSKQTPLDGSVVQPTYQHDLESLWWIALSIVTSLVEHETSHAYAKTVFRHELEQSFYRTLAFIDDIDGQLYQVLRGDISKVFAPFLENIRSKMYERAIVMEVFGQQKNPEEYSEIHGFFSTAFRDLKNNSDNCWKAVAIEGSSDIKNIKMDTGRGSTHDQEIGLGKKRDREDDGEDFGPYKKSRLSSSDVPSSIA